MESVAFSLSSPQTFLVALIFTFLSYFLALLAVRSLPPPKPKLGGASVATSIKNEKHCATCACCHQRDGIVAGSSDSEPLLNGPDTTTERQTGASMMEQLVPEITTHALSFLDYPSLCRLSMTNSLMRKAANDDNAWKTLYHKDFTLEQDSITPVNGWKAYYAATRAIVNVNTEFFNFIKERSLTEMSRLWLNADYVKCVHASGELFSGYNAVIQSWQLALNWEQGINFQIWGVGARILTDMAWVTMKTYVGVNTGFDTRPFNVTNVFELHNGRWYMVHHHSSVMDGEVEQQIVQG